MIKHAWKRGFIGVVVSCAALVSGPAQATDYTWTGASSANVSDTANWSPVPGGPFASTDALIFPAGVTVTNLVNTAVQTIASITFQAGAHPYTLSGSNFKYAHVTNESAANQTILNKLDWQQFSRSYVNNGSGTLKLGLIFSTKQPGKPLVTQSFDTTGDIVVTGGMTTIGTPFDLYKTGSGSLTLQGTYDFNIGTNHISTLEVDGGTLDVTDMDVNFEDDNTGGPVEWSTLTGSDYTLIDYSGGSIVINGSAIFRSVAGLSGSSFVLGHDTGAKRVFISRLPAGTIITVR